MKSIKSAIIIGLVSLSSLLAQQIIIHAGSLLNGTSKKAVSKRSIIVENGKIVERNPIRPALNVNELPIQDLSIFEPDSLFRPMMGKIYRMAPVETQRGCPYSCVLRAPSIPSDGLRMLLPPRVRLLPYRGNLYAAPLAPRIESVYPSPG